MQQSERSDSEVLVELYSLFNLEKMSLDFAAGCLGGCAGILVGHPLDTIKVRMQTQDYRNPVYRSAWHCFRTMVKTESVSGLYKGMSSPMAGVAVVNAIVFGVFGNVQRNLSEPESLKSYFISGAIAGLSQSIIASPMELIKTRLQIQTKQLYRNPFHCLVMINRQEGIRGVLKGLNVTAVREVIGYGVYFYVYEALSRSAMDDMGSLSTWNMLLFGGLSGCASWILSYPIDVVKSRYQADGMQGVAKYSSVLDCFRKSISEEGWKCLFRGLSPTLARAFPTNAVTFTVVTWMFKLAGETDTDAIDGSSFSYSVQLSEHLQNIYPCGILKAFYLPANQHYLLKTTINNYFRVFSVSGLDDMGSEIFRDDCDFDKNNNNNDSTTDLDILDSIGKEYVVQRDLEIVIEDKPDEVAIDITHYVKYKDTDTSVR